MGTELAPLKQKTKKFVELAPLKQQMQECGVSSPETKNTRMLS